MKTILVTTDFSSAAMNATNYAADMASAINADLLLLHVYQIPFSYGEIPVPIDPEEMMENAAEQLKKVKEELDEKTNGTLHIETEVTLGTFFQQLKEVCERVTPYTVVMGSQGTSAVQRFLFGSNSVYAIKHLMWPLMTVPPDVSFAKIKNIGLACDFDEVVDTIPLDEIKTLVNDFNANLHVLNTGKKSEFKPGLIFESHILHTMLSDFKPNYHFITAKDTDKAIMDFVENNNIDLLVVLPKRHDLFETIVHTSHSKQLVLHCHVPVMALHH